MSETKYTISAEQRCEVLEVSRLLAVTSDLDHLLSEIAKATQTLLVAERRQHLPLRRHADELWTKVALGG